MVMGIVNTYNAYDTWAAWHEAGAKLLLRPNWWHMGAVAPHLPLHVAGSFFKYAQENSMIGFDFDQLLGYWAAQGPYYYLIARLSVRPEMTVDEVIDEYCKGFGPASSVIREYIDFWEDFTMKAAYPIPAGGAVSQDKNGLYEVTAREHNINIHPLAGSWFLLPWLYTEEVLEPAYTILARAKTVSGNDTIVNERIQFLYDGLVHLEKTRDFIRMDYNPDYYEGEKLRELNSFANDLDAWRNVVDKRHVIDLQQLMRVIPIRNKRTGPEDY